VKKADNDDKSIYQAILDHEEQYSIWRGCRESPPPLSDQLHKSVFAAMRTVMTSETGLLWGSMSAEIIQILSRTLFLGIAETLSESTFPKDLRSLLESAYRYRNTGRFFFGMNGQFIRATIFIQLLNKLPVGAFIESGTFRGETSALIAAQTKLPILSCELNPMAYNFARLTLTPFGNRINLSLGSSREFLQKVIRDGLPKFSFFYLDAHWYEDLPLRDEIAVIVSSLSSFVIAIDDFKVPADEGFRYDQYEDSTLELAYIRSSLSKSNQDLYVFFPSYPSRTETGAARGFVLVATRDLAERIEDTVPEFLLSPYAWCLRGVWHTRDS